jgi:hypothetical protein
LHSNPTGPEHRQVMGNLYVPMFRIGLIQMEIVLRSLKEKYYEQLKVG